MANLEMARDIIFLIITAVIWVPTVIVILIIDSCAMKFWGKY